MGEEIRTAEQNIDIEPLFFCVDWDYNTIVGGYKYLKGYKILSFHFNHFTRILGMESKV
jgi:hypothetical protein